MILLRRCVGCRQMIHKNLLIRVSKYYDLTSEKTLILLDLKQKAGGRGAYVCHNKTCLELAKKTKGFERSLKHALPKEIYNALCLTIDN